MEHQFPKRKPLRLSYFDYNTPGAYFITFCTHDKKHTLSHIVGAIHESPESQLTDCGRIVEKIICDLPQHLNATIDRYVIMPNHVHLIVMIPDDEGSRAIRESPLRARSIISNTVGYIKMNASKQIHRLYGAKPVWQRGFHDHIVRDRYDYEKIAAYIYENPLRWKSDCFYTEGE